MEMSREEIEKWDDLYFYVKFDILGYEPRKNLTKYMVLKLKELRSGKVMNNQDNLSAYEYTYDEILWTFKFKKQDILEAINRIEFANENNKFNYILAIIKNYINDVVDMLARAKKQKEKSESIDTEYFEQTKAKYKRKDKKVSDRLNDLW